MRTSKKNKINNICYICGKEGADSDDHIPPKTIFPNKQWYCNLITVKTHEKCNKSYSKDDEYFRDNLVLVASGLNKDAAAIFDTKMIRAFKRDEAKRYRKYFLEQTSTVDIKSKSGLFLKKLPIKFVDGERIENVIKRICRGLYFHHSLQVLKSSCPMSVNWLKPEAIEIRKILIEKKVLITVVPGVFEYYHRMQVDDPEGNSFYLFFYNCFVFQVSTGRVVNNLPKPGESIKHDSLRGINFTKDTLWFPPGQSPV